MYRDTADFSRRSPFGEARQAGVSEQNANAPRAVLFEAGVTLAGALGVAAAVCVALTYFGIH